MHSKVEKDLATYLDPLALGGWTYHPVVGSTNDLAMDWAKKGALDWALVIADQQEAGRGRENRRWVTRPGSGLAVSLVLRPSLEEQALLPRFTALGALGVVYALADMGLTAKIKWPNDILLQDKKVGGVLVETDWRENQLASLVIGLGVNVDPDAVPPANQLRYPATSVTQVFGAPVDRWKLLAEILKKMMALRSALTEDEFIDAWNMHLALRGEQVPIRSTSGDVKVYQILEVTPWGNLRVLNKLGQVEEIISGEICMKA